FGICLPSTWTVEGCVPLLCHEFATLALARRNFDDRQSFQSADTSNRVSGFLLNQGRPNIPFESSLTHLLPRESRNGSGIRPKGSSSCPATAGARSSSL